MKFTQEQNRAVTSENFETQSFSIGDDAFIMNLLRKRIYSDPLQVIVQEVASNARDANREAGHPDRPIEITLPTHDAPILKIRDHGIGISPARMTNVYLKYGASTKRGTNDQTGGFGLGAKTPWAYSDSFTIKTVTKEKTYEDKEGIHENVKVERRYVAYIGKSGKGDLATIHTGLSNEECGTEISMAVRPSDFNSISSAVVGRLRFWNPLPKIINTTHYIENNLKPIDIVHKGSCWFSTGVSYDRHSCLVDGIEYPLEVEKVDSYIRNHSQGIRDKGSSPDSLRAVLTSFGYKLTFDTGEVEVSASREALEYSDVTLKAILNALIICASEIKDEMARSAAAASNVVEAHLSTLPILDIARQLNIELKWNGKKLPTSPITYSYREGLEVVHITPSLTSTSGYSRNRSKYSNPKLSASYNQIVVFEPTTQEPNIRPGRVRSVLQDKRFTNGFVLITKRTPFDKKNTYSGYNYDVDFLEEFEKFPGRPRLLSFAIHKRQLTGGKSRSKISNEHGYTFNSARSIVRSSGKISDFDPKKNLLAFSHGVNTGVFYDKDGTEFQTSIEKIADMVEILNVSRDSVVFVPTRLKDKVDNTWPTLQEKLHQTLLKNIKEIESSDQRLKDQDYNKLRKLATFAHDTMCDTRNRATALANTPFDPIKFRDSHNIVVVKNLELNSLIANSKNIDLFNEMTLLSKKIKQTCTPAHMPEIDFINECLQIAERDFWPFVVYTELYHRTEEIKKQFHQHYFNTLAMAKLTNNANVLAASKLATAETTNH
jgi:hypothetical protein